MNTLARVLLSAALLHGAAFCLAEEPDDTGRKSVWSSLDLQLYGYIKLDSAWDSARTEPGNFVKWVVLSPGNPDDEVFTMTVNQTRLGLSLRGPDEEEGLEVSGRVEIDFYGGGAENKPNPMLRHAYVKMAWPDSGWEFLAGQTSDLISPLVPNTINYSVAWWAGNIGYRRPQLRLTKAIEISDVSHMEVAAAITRDIGSTSSTFVGVDSGADAGVPGLQGRLGWLLGGRDTGPISFGVSGHWAEEEFDTSPEGHGEVFDSWSANLDYHHPFSSVLAFSAEVFTGSNLAQYLGGIGQGVNLDRFSEIDSKGGWFSFDLGPFGKTTYRLGASMDDPDDEDLEPGDRSLNSSVFANGSYAFNSHLKMGLELSYWSTDYLEAETADSYRGQFAVIYRF